MNRSPRPSLWNPFIFFIGVMFITLLATTPALAVKSNRKDVVPAHAATIHRLSLVIIRQEELTSKALPFFDPVITDKGIKGAELGIQDNNTTGQFTHQSFILKDISLPPEANTQEHFKNLVSQGFQHFLLSIPPEKFAEISKLKEANDVLLYDIANRDDRLRAADCAINSLHLIPNRRMRSDAIAQYLSKKRWNKWFLAIGPSKDDALYAEAIRQSAKKFGAKIIEERLWQYAAESRRTPEAEIPLFTQDGDYDVMFVVDEEGTFGELMAYRTWLPRPIVGTQGLMATAWHKTHEAWGGLQLQNRFKALSGRWMTEEDYGAWLAIRSIGEAASRTQSLDFVDIKSYLFGPEFSLAGFKGVPLSFRSWDHQLRQPILLVADRSWIAAAPIEGFLHPKNELDTLGFDEPESTCHFREDRTP